MKLNAIAIVAMFLGSVFVSAAQTVDAPAAEAQTFDVWPDKVPGETGNVGPEKILPRKPEETPLKLVTDVSKPTLTVYRPTKEKDTGACVVICPGGGYSVLAWDLEGTEVADWLNSAGVTGIVLKYRVPGRPGKPNYLPALQDAQRAMSLVRSKAADLKIDPNRIGLLGFSAGGNLTARACTGYEKRMYDAIDDVDKTSCRPDFGVLVYPAWLIKDKTDQLEEDIKVDAKTPPMFMVHAGNDGITPVNSVAMYLALKKAGVSSEVHVFPTGGHGFGLRKSNEPVSGWPKLCEAWMKNQKLLEAKPVAAGK